MSKRVLNISPERDSTTSPDSLFRCLTTPRVKNMFFLCSGGNTCILICIHCLLSCHSEEEFGSIFFTSCHHQMFIHTDKIFLSLPFSRLKNLSSLSLSSMSDGLEHLWGLCLWPFAEPVPVNPYLSCTEEFRTGHSTPDLSHQCWAERKYHLPQPASNIPPNAAQNAVGFLCCKMNCWVMVSLSTRTPRTFSAELLYSWLVPSMCWGSVIHPQVPEFAFSFVVLH